MIGKIMSEAAHSIIGMLSAKPVAMERSPINSDFGSLLRPAEGRPQSNNGDTEVDALDMAIVGSWDGNAALAQHRETTNGLPFANFSIGNMILGPAGTSQKLNQDPTVFGQDSLTHTGSQEITDASVLVTDETANPTNGVASEILSRQSNAIADTGFQIDKVPDIGLADIADARLAGNNIEAKDGADIVDGDKRRNQLALKAEELQVQPRSRENPVGDGILPSGDKGLLKLQNLQSQMSRENADFVQSSAAGMKLSDTELSAVKAANPETGKQAASSSLPGLNGGEQKDMRSEFSPSAFRLPLQDISPDSAIRQPKPNVVDDETSGATKLDSQSIAKSSEASIEQQAIASPAIQPAVRDMMRRTGSFDLSAPQVAERLAAEISDVSTNGGRKTFEINPRNLGRMEITFTTRGSTEVVEIQTENRAAKDIIVQNSQLLQDILKSQGRDDLTFRVDVKESMATSTRTDGNHLSQQENRDTQEQQARPSQHDRMISTPDNIDEDGPASDNSRYA